MSLDRFRKVYSLVPESERRLPIIVIDDERFNWERSYEEIVKNTDMGKKIQKKLEELGII